MGKDKIGNPDFAMQVGQRNGSAAALGKGKIGYGAEYRQAQRASFLPNIKKSATNQAEQ